MSRQEGYQLSDLSPVQSTSSRSRESDDSTNEASTQNPFSDLSHSAVDNQSSSAYDPGDRASAPLFLDGNQQHNFYDRAFTDGWGWEISAWVLATVSLVALVIVFAVFSNRSFRQWGSGITPNTVVSILSQIGQTAILAPVTACICQSTWLWLHAKSRATEIPDQDQRFPQLIDMQIYDDGSRGPLGSLLLLPLPGSSTAFDLGSITPSMVAKLTDGLMNNNISPSNVSGSCPTGNCTWDIYQSMGVCASVIDVSPSITSRCRNVGSQFNPTGCYYSVPAIDENPTAFNTTFHSTTSGDTLWVGASKVTADYKYPGLNTLVQFYVVYAPDLETWAANDHTKDHKSQLIALEATLKLCVYTYNSSMTFGVTSTTEISRSTDLNWQLGYDVSDQTYPIINTTKDSEGFWMHQENMESFNTYLSLRTFTGSAQMQTDAIDFKDNSYTTDTVRAIAASIYGKPPGIQGLSYLLGNLSTSITNGYPLRKSNITQKINGYQATHNIRQPKHDQRSS
ncbi:MAG: hypothetical protein Q9167_000311 [Letrouitia subvulpina]